MSDVAMRHITTTSTTSIRSLMICLTAVWEKNCRGWQLYLFVKLTKNYLLCYVAYMFNVIIMTNNVSVPFTSSHTVLLQRSYINNNL